MNGYLVVTYMYLLRILTLKKIPQWYISILLFMMFKMIFEYKKCTLSYIEVKLRGVPKREGYIYQLLEGFINLRYLPDFRLIMILSFYILYSRTTMFDLLVN